MEHLSHSTRGPQLSLGRNSFVCRNKSGPFVSAGSPDFSRVRRFAGKGKGWFSGVHTLYTSASHAELVYHQQHHQPQNKLQIRLAPAPPRDENIFSSFSPGEKMRSSQNGVFPAPFSLAAWKIDARPAFTWQEMEKTAQGTRERAKWNDTPNEAPRQNKTAEKSNSGREQKSPPATSRRTFWRVRHDARRRTHRLALRPEQNEFFALAAWVKKIQCSKILLHFGQKKLISGFSF